MSHFQYSLFNYFAGNNLISLYQSGFIPGGSCVQQLISITHEIYNAFDFNPSYEVQGLFLDIPFNKVWHDGLIYKLERNSINGDLLRLYRTFLQEGTRELYYMDKPLTRTKLRLELRVYIRFIIFSYLHK